MEFYCHNFIAKIPSNQLFTKELPSKLIWRKNICMAENFSSFHTVNNVQQILSRKLLQNISWNHFIEQVFSKIRDFTKILLKNMAKIRPHFFLLSARFIAIRFIGLSFIGYPIQPHNPVSLHISDPSSSVWRKKTLCEKNAIQWNVCKGTAQMISRKIWQIFSEISTP